MIQLADQLSPNCSKGLESCKDGMSFSSRQPDLLVAKASKEKSHRDRHGAILSLCHSRLLHNFVHIYKFLEYMNLEQTAFHEALLNSWSEIEAFINICQCNVDKQDMVIFCCFLNPHIHRGIYKSLVRNNYLKFLLFSICWCVRMCL